MTAQVDLKIPSQDPRSLRQRAKRLTQAIGIYPLIRDTKERLYGSVENWQWPIYLQLHQLLNVPIHDVQRIAEEFEAENIWRSINDRIQQEVAADPTFWHGTSSEQDLRRLYILCRLHQPRQVVETGVASGASSFTILTALQKNGAGELYSIDLPPDEWSGQIPDYRVVDKVSLPPKKGPGWLVPESLRARWHFIAGDSKIELPKLLQKLGRCDLFYHDAEHTYDAMLREFQTVWPAIAAGGLMASDDVHWNKAFNDFRRQTPTVRNAFSWRGFGIMRKKAE